VDRLCAPHPWLRPDAAHPVGEARDEAEILDDVLFADQSHRHDTSGRDGEGHTEEALQHEDAFGMVAQSPVTKIGGDRLGLVDYVDSHRQ
jgi:hypothetical protein